MAGLIHEAWSDISHLSDDEPVEKVPHLVLVPKYTTLARRFVMVREEDVSGVSGTGVVAEGTVYSNGAVSYTWLTHLTTMAWAPSIDVLKNIHGHGGKTKIVFIDPENA